MIALIFHCLCLGEIERRWELFEIKKKFKSTTMMRYIITWDERKSTADWGGKTAFRVLFKSTRETSKLVCIWNLMNLRILYTETRKKMYFLEEKQSAIIMIFLGKSVCCDYREMKNSCENKCQMIDEDAIEFAQ